MIKYYWKTRDQRSKSVNSKQSNIHQLQSCHFLWFLYSLCYRISGSTSSFLARQSQRFFQNIIAHYLQEMKKSNYVVWPAPSSKYLKMACGPKSLATHVLDLRMRSIEVIGCKNIAMWQTIIVQIGYLDISQLKFLLEFTGERDFHKWHFLWRHPINQDNWSDT